MIPILCLTDIAVVSRVRDQGPDLHSGFLHLIAIPFYQEPVFHPEHVPYQGQDKANRGEPRANMAQLVCSDIFGSEQELAAKLNLVHILWKWATR
jgi:hypothetical protein